MSPYEGVEVFTAKQEVEQEGDKDVVKLPSVVIKRDGLFQEFNLNMEDDTVEDEASFTFFCLSETYLQASAFESAIVARLRQSGRLLHAVVGEDRMDAFQFYTRITEVIVRA